MSDALPIPAQAKWADYVALADALKTGRPSPITEHWQQQKEKGTAEEFLAQAHGFANWNIFETHIRQLGRASTITARFEAAADAIINGNDRALRKLLRESPRLIHARSNRAHGSTLLHYVSANGVENFRQKTPPNIVAITRLLLKSGANVNAESAAYGGGSTALNLTATSCHPRDAGVQIDLLELLLAHGAVIEPPTGMGIVTACLYNGRREAAALFARHGARLNIEDAAGVGRLALVKTLFQQAEQKQRETAFAWACQYGRTKVAAFLLEAGIPIDASLRHHGQTGLHWAASGGHPTTVALLLANGAPINVKDPTFHGTPLDWALYSWSETKIRARESGVRRVVALLRQSGGTYSPAWLNSENTQEKLRRDHRMRALLR